MNIRRSFYIMLVFLAAVYSSFICMAAEDTQAEQPVPTVESGFDQFAAEVNEALVERMETLQKMTDGQHTENELLKSIQEVAGSEYRKLEEYFDIENQSDAETDQVLLTQKAVMNTYMKGLKMQAEADLQSTEQFFQDWGTGYHLRASAIMEMEQILKVEVSDEVRPVLEKMYSYTGINKEDGIAAWFIQGFLAHEGKMDRSGIDGKAGPETRRLLREYLLEKKAKIPCVIISEQLLTHLAEEGIITQELFDEAMNIETPNGQTIKDKCTEADPLFAFLSSV